MEPIFMGQLPELMKNYKDGETEILTGLEEKLQVVFQKAQQMQKADRKGKICTMGISYLQSSVLTENYELRIDLYDKEFYLDSAECCTYWKPEFVTGYLLQDVEYLKKEIRFKIPQIKTYELQQFIDGYLLNYMYLLAQFFQQILPQVLDKTKTLFQEVAEENSILKYVTDIDEVKGLLLWEKEKNEVLSAELGGNRESGAEDSKLDGETGLSGSSKKRIGEVTGANHSFFGRKSAYTVF